MTAYSHVQELTPLKIFLLKLIKKKIFLLTDGKMISNLKSYKFKKMQIQYCYDMNRDKSNMPNNIMLQKIKYLNNKWENLHQKDL